MGEEMVVKENYRKKVYSVKAPYCRFERSLKKSCGPELHGEIYASPFLDFLWKDDEKNSFWEKYDGEIFGKKFSLCLEGKYSPLRASGGCEPKFNFSISGSSTLATEGASNMKLPFRLELQEGILASKDGLALKKSLEKGRLETGRTLKYLLSVGSFEERGVKVQATLNLKSRKETGYGKMCLVRNNLFGLDGELLDFVKTLLVAKFPTRPLFGLKDDYLFNLGEVVLEREFPKRQRFWKMVFDAKGRKDFAVQYRESFPDKDTCEKIIVPLVACGKLPETQRIKSWF